jgi:hypothetical protein|tara:strand:+ start:507 stop:1244 length:738 start_codon:yes stop_codon:yes gene_type:complete
MKNILCVRWGNKYDGYVEKLRLQLQKHCTVDYKFYCLTDKPKFSYDIQLPVAWDHHYNSKRNAFWAYRKCYMFNEDLFPELKYGKEFLYLDLDVLIHNSIDSLFQLDTVHPWIVRGWWNDMETCKKNYGKLISTPINSSIIRWNRGQLKPIYDHIETNTDYIFFTYPTIDNYFNHYWYDMHNEENSKQLFRGLEKGITYSWFKGNIFPEDMDLHEVRNDHMICLFNNCTEDTYQDMYEIIESWNI